MWLEEGLAGGSCGLRRVVAGGRGMAGGLGGGWRDPAI